jgi:hypothetical protein
MKSLVILVILATLAWAIGIGTSWAGVVAQATSLQGHKIRLTDERCTAVSGRSSQAGWGRTYTVVAGGQTMTGCGRLDNDTVLIEWFIPPATLDTRRYAVDDFVWAPGKQPLDK